jgi:hypothetical protein
MKSTYCALASVLSILLITAPTQARDFGEGLVNGGPPRMLANANRQHSHWSGIGRIRNESNTLCTASLLDTRDAQGNSGPAYVLTSSHCIHRLNGVVQKDLPIKGSISFNYFDDTLEQLKKFPLKTIRWGSSQGVDLAIIELEAPLSGLIASGIQPMKLAEEVPADGSDILALSAPEWETLHVSACTQQRSEETVEQPFVWRVTMKNQCQGIQLGSFGAPLVTRDGNRLFGILGTSTAGKLAENKCQREAPCEIHAGQPVWHADTHYGSPVTFLSDCFVEGVLQANAQTCNLYPTTSIQFRNPKPIQQYFVKNTPGRRRNITPRWDLTFTTNTPLYRYKATRRAIECENPALYSAPIDASNAHINDAIGPQTGMHMLCIVGVESADQPVTVGMMRNALTLAVELAEPGPARTPDVEIVLDRRALQGYLVTWNLAAPFMNRYSYKYGPAASTDCLRPVDYNALPSDAVEPTDEALDIYDHPLDDDSGQGQSGKTALIIAARDQPYKICTYAFDQADQPSTLRTDLLKPR